MDLLVEEFVTALRLLTPSSIHAAAFEIRHRSDDARWLEAIVAIEQVLRRSRRSIEAAGAARAAASAVTTAAGASALTPNDADVECLRRRAADVARGLLVADAVRPHMEWLLQGWQRIISFRLPPSPRSPAPPSWWDIKRDFSETA